MKLNTESGNNFQRGETLVISTMAFAAYLVILVFVVLGVTILFQGLPAVFQLGSEFFTMKSQPVYGFFDSEENYYRLSESEFLQFQQNNPHRPIFLLEKSSNWGGGILGPFSGTMLLLAVSLLIATAFSLSTAIFLSEFDERQTFGRVVRSSIRQLAAIPSIVYGVFGLLFFSYYFPVLTSEAALPRSLLSIPFPSWLSGLFGETELALSFQGWGPSLISAGSTVACMVFPPLTLSFEQALRLVPVQYREDSQALGASLCYSLIRTVLPAAVPDMLQSVAFNSIRIVGATTAILFTGAVLSGEPNQRSSGKEGFLGQLSDFFQQPFEAISYHVFKLSTEASQSKLAQPVSQASALFLLLIILVLAIIFVGMKLRFSRSQEPDFKLC